ncbi:MAG TPA: hypothetical protein ENI62_06525 [Gammaproteobacteria bacterium]|nr:hypothetical protein [Gammaproteobacteria bacterium]
MAVMENGGLKKHFIPEILSLLFCIPSLLFHAAISGNPQKIGGGVTATPLLPLLRAQHRHR